MSLNPLPNNTYSTVCRIFAVASCVAISAISIYHILTTSKHSSIKKCKRPVYLSMLLLFFSIYTIFNLTIEIFDDFHSPSFCGYSKFVAIPSYIAYKCLLYLILVNRIHNAFSETQYQIVNTTGLKIWIFIIIFWSVANIVLVMFTTTVEFDDTKVPKCHTKVFRPTLMAMALLDLTACGVNLYLFVKPVTKLTAVIKHINAQAGDEENEHNNVNQLKRVAIKQCTLSIIAVSTTVIGMILIAMFSMEQIFIGLDICVSTSSIILMYKWNDYLVTKLCCLCVKDERQSLSHSGIDVTDKSGKRPSNNTVPTGTLATSLETNNSTNNSSNKESKISINNDSQEMTNLRNDTEN